MKFLDKIKFFVYKYYILLFLYGLLIIIAIFELYIFIIKKI